MEYRQYETKPSSAEVGLALLIFSALALIVGFIAGYNYTTKKMNQELISRKLKHYNQTSGELVWAGDTKPIIQNYRNERENMTRATESKIRAIFSKLIDTACDEISENTSCYWPDGYEERMADMLTQAIALMDESTEKLRKEEGE